MRSPRVDTTAPRSCACWRWSRTANTSAARPLPACASAIARSGATGAIRSPQATRRAAKGRGDLVGAPPCPSPASRGRGRIFPPCFANFLPLPLGGGGSNISAVLESFPLPRQAGEGQGGGVVVFATAPCVGITGRDNDQRERGLPELPPGF